MLLHYTLFLLSFGYLIYIGATQDNWGYSLIALFFYFLGWHRGYLRYVKHDDYTWVDAARDVKKSIDEFGKKK